MDAQKLQTLIDSLHLEDGLTLDELPDIDLYMDQLITLCDSQLASYRRHPEDKLLTKTMINNYSKKKLLTTVHKKKYSKYQILLIYLIFQLKQVTSIDDIGVNSLMTALLLFDQSLNYKRLAEKIIDTCLSGD